MEFIYCDADIAVCVKPPRVLSTDEPGGMPELVRQALGDEKADVRTVHRLDRVVSGLMVLARSGEAAAALSGQIRNQTFEKEYMAVIHGCPEGDTGAFCDLLLRDKSERKTYLVSQPGKGVQEARLTYQVQSVMGDMTRVRIQLQTGRTHQIRAQFSGHGFPLVGDRKYGIPDEGCEIALWSYRLAFAHPRTGEAMEFVLEPPDVYPWSI